MTTTETPIQIHDAGTIQPANVTAVNVWLIDEGLNPKDVRRIEVYRRDGKFVGVVTEFLCDADGHHYCPLDHAHDPLHPDGCEIASRVREVPLKSIPQALQ